MEKTIEETVDVLYESCKKQCSDRTKLVSVQAMDIVAVIDYLRDGKSITASQEDDG